VGCLCCTTVNPVSELSAELAPLWRAVHDRLSSGRPVSRVRVGPLDCRQRDAVADLLGLGRMPGEYVTISLATLDQILTESVGVGAREVATQLVGAPGDRAGDRARAAAERAELWAWLNSHPVLAAQPALEPWAMTGASSWKTRERAGPTTGN
jgi:Protein of unknown function N-terminus (DUF3323)